MMNIKKLERLYAVLVLSVCLFAALTLSYKVFAADTRKSDLSQKEQKKEEVSAAVVEELKEELGRKRISPFIREVAKEIEPSVPLMNEEDKKAFLRQAEEEREKKEAELKKEEAERKEREAKEEGKKSRNAFHIQMTDKDLTNLYRLVQSEVGFMDEKSKLLVASVVLNRVNSKKFPNTVSGVVLQKIGKVYQFSPVAPGKRFWSCSVSPETKAAVDKVLKNGDYSKGALYFVAKKYTTKGAWFDRNLAWISHHEGHDYYRER